MSWKSATLCFCTNRMVIYIYIYILEGIGFRLGITIRGHFLSTFNIGMLCSLDDGINFDNNRTLCMFPSKTEIHW